MTHYRIQIPHDIFILFLSVIKKERIHRSILITSDVVMVQTTDGGLCYTHGIRFSKSRFFTFPVDFTAQPSSDVYLEWDTVTNETGEVHVENAKYKSGRIVLNVEQVSCSKKTSPQFPAFNQFPCDLTSSIPALSKCANLVDARRSYSAPPGIVFTRRSAFATDGRQFASWSGTSPAPQVCRGTAAILAQYTNTYAELIQKTTAVCGTLYKEFTINPQKYKDPFFQDDDLETPESRLSRFTERFPNLETFIKEHCLFPNEPPAYVPITFPKYLEKVLTLDKCEYGFAIDYSQELFQRDYEPSPDGLSFPSDISFFLLTSTYEGRRLPGYLIWHTQIGIPRLGARGSVDSMLFDKYEAFDDKFRYTIPASTFSTFQEHLKTNTPFTNATSASGVAFVNHQGKLGIGSLFNHEIHSTPTSLPLPAGIDQYIIIPQAVIDIPIPAHAPSITFTFDEWDTTSHVYITVGSITYCYARIENTNQDGERVPYPIRFQDTPLSIPPAPKLRFFPSAVQ